MFYGYLVGGIAVLYLILATARRKERHHFIHLLRLEIRQEIEDVIKEANLPDINNLNAGIQKVLDAVAAEKAEVTAAIEELKAALEAAGNTDFSEQIAKLEEAVTGIQGIVEPPVV